MLQSKPSPVEKPEAGGLHPQVGGARSNMAATAVISQAGGQAGMAATGFH
jgi:hypothetical protein